MELNMDLNINCEWENSTINPNLRICKYCNFVISIDDTQADHRVCPVLIDIAAHDPKYKQIKLQKISTYKSDGSILEQTIDQNAINSSAKFGDWWFGGLSDSDIKAVSQLQAHKLTAEMAQAQPTAIPNNMNEQGRPCTQEQIDMRLSICKGCEFYKNNSCLKCGCSLSRDKNYMNKLYWADKSCPIGKWGPVE